MTWRQNKSPKELGMVTRACDLSTQELEAEGSKFRVTLGFTRSLKLDWNTGDNNEQ